MSPVTGSFPKSILVNKRGRNLVVAAFFMLLPPEIKERVEHFPAAWEPVRHTRSGFIHEEKVKLRAEFSVVALFRFFQEIKVFFELSF